MLKIKPITSCIKSREEQITISFVIDFYILNTLIMSPCIFLFLIWANQITLTFHLK